MYLLYGLLLKFGDIIKININNVPTYPSIKDIYFLVSIAATNSNIFYVNIIIPT